MSSLRLRPDHGSPWRDPHFSDCIEELLAKPVNGINAPQRPDCVAGAASWGKLRMPTVSKRCWVGWRTLLGGQ